MYKLSRLIIFAQILLKITHIQRGEEKGQERERKKEIDREIERRRERKWSY